MYRTLPVKAVLFVKETSARVVISIVCAMLLLLAGACSGGKMLSLSALEGSGKQAITVFLLDETKIVFAEGSYSVVDSRGKKALKGKGIINDSGSVSEIEIEDTDIQRIVSE